MTHTRLVILSIALPCCAAKPKLPENFEDATWEKLKDTVQAVHAKQPVSTSLEELYRVTNPPPPPLSGSLFPSGQQRPARPTCLPQYAHIHIRNAFRRQWRTCACTRWRTGCTHGSKRYAVALPDGARFQSCPAIAASSGRPCPQRSCQVQR